MAVNPSMLDNADLWGLNPQTGRLYTTSERRAMLQDRGIGDSMNAVMSDPMWDRYFDALNEANYAATGKTPASLRVNFAGGSSAPGSNQLRGRSVQPGFSIADDPDSSYNTNPDVPGNRPHIAPFVNYGSASPASLHAMLRHFGLR